MAIGNLPSNKLACLTLQGYNPYQPDCGIYCGGYQGIMYPNPTTLIAPSIFFDPYEHTNPVATAYPMSTPYAGLGIGNPGISYVNPGHILGLFDTYGRMNYGIRFLREAHAGIDIISNPTPFISDMSLPFMSGQIYQVEGEGGEPPPENELRLIDIYPAVTEKPGDWYNYFSVDSIDGEVTPDIRPWVPFTVGSPYEPGVAAVDAEMWNTLFPGSRFEGEAVLLGSYRGIINRLRSYLSQFYTIAEPLANLFTTSFTLTNAKHFDTFTHDVWMPDYDHPDYDGTSIIDEGTYSHQCAVLTPLQALNALTKKDSLHGGAEPTPWTFEYRSLTELNSAINIVPIQAAGASYQSDVIYPLGGGINNLSLHGFWVYAFTITDVVVNLSESEVALGTVSVDGNVTVKSLITDPSPFYTKAEYREIADPPQAGWAEAGATGGTTTTEYDILQRSKKRVDMRAMLTNKHSFDKVWLGAESNQQEYAIGEERDILLSYGDIDITDFVVPFSQTFDLSAGCNSLKMRFIIRNKHFITPNPDMDRYISEDSWSPFSELLPAPWYAIILGIAEPGDMWTWYPGGTQSCEHINDPDTLRSSIVSPSIILSLNITSPGRNSIIREISI